VLLVPLLLLLLLPSSHASMPASSTQERDAPLARA
jgi:hypothetical protein